VGEMPDSEILAPPPEETRQERGRAEDACDKARPAGTPHRILHAAKPWHDL